jgi:hypothetical protein
VHAALGRVVQYVQTDCSPNELTHNAKLASLQLPMRELSYRYRAPISVNDNVPV